MADDHPPRKETTRRLRTKAGSDVPHATEVAGCIVHGDMPMTAEGEEAVRGIIAAVQARNASDPLKTELAACRMAILRAADIAADHAALTNNSGLLAESARFLHQAAKVRALLEGTANG